MANPATMSNGVLTEIEDCYIIVPNPNPNFGGSNCSLSEFSANSTKCTSLKIPMRILPDISDSKGATYNDESVIGRSYPMKTFSHGDNRAISWTAYFMICSPGDARNNLIYLRAIQSAVYPRSGEGGAPYSPPPVCVLSCGKQFTNSKSVCAVLRNYSVKFPTDVPWDEETYLPYKFSVDMSWEIVYSSNNLPGSTRIFNDYYFG
jgi:hypothetical protein